MSMESDIIEGIAGRVKVSKIDVDRSAREHNVAVWKITVMTPIEIGGLQEHVFTFAKHNNMSGQQMGEVIVSYLE